MKFDIGVYIENLSRKFSFHYNRTRIKGTLHEDQCTFSIICHSFLLRMKSFSDKCVDKLEVHILCSATFFENLVIYEIMWKNVVDRDRPQMTI